MSASKRASEAELLASLGVTSHTAAAASRETNSRGSLFGDGPPSAEKQPDSWARYLWPGPSVPSLSQVPVFGQPASLPTPRGDHGEIVSTDPLRSAVAATRVTSSAVSGAPAGTNTPVAASTSRPVGFGSAEMAPPSWGLPLLTSLHTGETLLDKPAAAPLVKPGLPSQPGTLYLSNLRALWEPIVAPAAGARRSAGADGADVFESTPRAAVLVSVPLNSIEKLRKLKLGRDDGVVHVEAYTYVHSCAYTCMHMYMYAYAHVCMHPCISRDDGIVHTEVPDIYMSHQPWALCDPDAHQLWAPCDPMLTSPGPHVIIISQVLQKYNARAVLRVELGDSEYARISGILRTQIGTPAQSADVHTS